MYFKVSYDQEFDDIMMHLKSKYSSKLFDMEGIGKQLDMHIFSKEFFTNNSAVADLSVDSNSNIDTRDVISYNFELPKPFMRFNSYYILWKKLRQLYSHAEANRIIEMQLSGDIYINDFGDIGRPYCFNFSTYDIALQGLPMVKKIKSVAPKYLTAFKSQLEQFVVIASNSTLGATGLADMLIVMAYYTDRMLETGKDSHFYFKGEEDIWIYVKEQIASFIYTVNQPMRGNQSPFTNVSIYDINFLESLVPEYKFVRDEKTYTPKIETVQKLQDLYMQVMNEELRRTPVTFPVTTACFTVDDDKEIMDRDFLHTIAEANKEFGFINIYHGTSSTLSSCCRLRSSIENEYFNVFGAGSSKIGSLGVVTVNLPRLAYKIKGEFINGESSIKFLEALEDLVITTGKINNAKRHIIKKRVENGNLPLYELGFMNLSKQYSTAGVTGLNEVCELFGYDILNEEGQAFVLEILNVINTTNEKLQKQYQSPHNVEQVPAENSSIKLASKDTLLGFNYNNYEFYSNQFIPLVTQSDMLDRIKLQGLFDSHFSGGAICHINVGERITDTKLIEDLIETCAKQGVVYWAINYNIQRCENDHMSVGNGEKCSICAGEIVDNLTRVVGFLTNVKNWHKVRRTNDYPKRQFYGKKNENREVVGKPSSPIELRA